MPTIEPFEDRVLLKKVETENRTSGGLFIPETARKEPSQEAEIIAVGPGRVLDDGTITKMHVKVGERVWVGKYSGAEVNIGEDVFHIMRQADLLGRVVND